MPTKTLALLWWITKVIQPTLFRRGWVRWYVLLTLRCFMLSRGVTSVIKGNSHLFPFEILMLSRQCSHHIDMCCHAVWKGVQSNLVFQIEIGNNQAVSLYIKFWGHQTRQCFKACTTYNTYCTSKIVARPCFTLAKCWGCAVTASINTVARWVIYSTTVQGGSNSREDFSIFWHKKRLQSQFSRRGATGKVMAVPYFLRLSFLWKSTSFCQGGGFTFLRGLFFLHQKH